MATIGDADHQRQPVGRRNLEYQKEVKVHGTDCERHVKKQKSQQVGWQRKMQRSKNLEHQVQQARRRKRFDNKKQMVQKVLECVSAERTLENDV